MEQAKKEFEKLKKKVGDNDIVCDNESCTAVNAYNDALDKAWQWFKLQLEEEHREQVLHKSYNKFIVTENMVMWAFRYALGRKTGAVLDVVEQLKIHWENLKPFTQKQIKQEISFAIKMKMAGDDCDIEKWNEIKNLKEIK